METHLSWLFFTTSKVLKMKKPLRYERLDYSSPTIRSHLCRMEIRLNRRLAPETYLGIRTVTRDANGQLTLDGTGEALEHLVAMGRLSEDRNLEFLIERDAITEQGMGALAATLARFHARQPAWRPASGCYLSQLERFVQQDIHSLHASSYGLNHVLLRRLATELEKALRDRRAEVETRIRAGRLLEGHGDLRPEHVYLDPVPVIIDCLEFNKILRILDVADEIAFFAMECDRLGASWIGEYLVARYQILSHDETSELLLHWYKARRAILWAKLAVWHLGRTSMRERDQWISRAEDYLNLARSYMQ